MKVSLAPLLLAAALLGAAQARAVSRRKALRQAPAEEAAPEPLVKAMHFNQRLLICNAYPSAASMTVLKNEKTLLANGTTGLAFRECRYMNTSVVPEDRLDLSLVGMEVEGTFEVGDLPASDAVLLLVLVRRPNSTLVSFQSYAFPPIRDGSEVQLAVIDAGGEGTRPRLKMEDHVEATAKEEEEKTKKKSARRVEELGFNRIYAVSEGSYDATVTDRNGGPGAPEVALSATKAVRLARSQNYVVLRVGDDQAPGDPQDIIVFPEAPLHSAACFGALPGVAFLAAILAVIA